MYAYTQTMKSAVTPTPTTMNRSRQPIRARRRSARSVLGAGAPAAAAGWGRAHRPRATRRAPGLAGVVVGIDGCRIALLPSAVAAFAPDRPAAAEVRVWDTAAGRADGPSVAGHGPRGSVTPEAGGPGSVRLDVPVRRCDMDPEPRAGALVLCCLRSAVPSCGAATRMNGGAGGLAGPRRLALHVHRVELPGVQAGPLVLGGRITRENHGSTACP